MLVRCGGPLPFEILLLPHSGRGSQLLLSIYDRFLGINEMLIIVKNEQSGSFTLFQWISYLKVGSQIFNENFEFCVALIATSTGFSSGSKRISSEIKGYCTATIYLFVNCSYLRVSIWPNGPD